MRAALCRGLQPRHERARAPDAAEVVDLHHAPDEVALDSEEVAARRLPALLTSRCTVGAARGSAPRARRRRHGRPTSHSSTSPPISSASAWSRSSRRATRTHRQPRSASRRAIASPIPAEAPVTTAIRSSRASDAARQPLGSPHGGPVRGKAGARARRREQALDRLGDRGAARGRGRAARVHVPGRAHREVRCATSRRRVDTRSSTDATCAPTTTSTASSRRPPTRSAAGSTSSSTRSPSRPPRISKAASPTRRATASGWRRHQRVLARRRAPARAEPLMEARGGGSIVTMTYLGGERAVPHYNVMGVAKATLDASMRYLAWDLGAHEHPRQRDLRRPGADARRALDRGLHDDGGDVRRARAAAPPHRRRRRRRRRGLPALGRRART